MNSQEFTNVINTILQGIGGVLKAWEFWVPFIIIIIILVILIRKGVQSDSISIGLPFGLGNVSFSTTPTDRIIAWQFYVQLKTRKAALLFNENDDLIVDVYDSLFQLFNEARELLLHLSAKEFSRKHGLADLMLRTLNDGIRPHLTKWQSKYRRWWAQINESIEVTDISPQALQKRYPEYTDLISDLKATNIELDRFANALIAIAQREKHKRPQRRRIKPEAPF